MSNLTFNVSKKWFDLYKAGLKRKEYREIKDKWTKQMVVRYSGSTDLEKEIVLFCLKEGPHCSSFKTFDTVTICLAYPAKDDLERRIAYKFVGISIGYAEAGIGKELMGDERVFVIEMEDI
jgi:hypothetical protein